jgi:osmotically inducible lipoprotein OsmB
MRTLRYWIAGLTIAVAGLSGCATTTGAVLGGMAGHAVGGTTASTVGGAVVGGIIGNGMGD